VAVALVPSTGDTATPPRARRDRTPSPARPPAHTRSTAWCRYCRGHGPRSSTTGGSPPPAGARRPPRPGRPRSGTRDGCRCPCD